MILFTLSYAEPFIPEWWVRETERWRSFDGKTGVHVDSMIQDPNAELIGLSVNVDMRYWRREPLSAFNHSIWYQPQVVLMLWNGNHYRASINEVATMSDLPLINDQNRNDSQTDRMVTNLLASTLSILQRIGAARCGN